LGALLELENMGKVKVSRDVQEMEFVDGFTMKLLFLPLTCVDHI
jgi:hypothetical protein